MLGCPGRDIQEDLGLRCRGGENAGVSQYSLNMGFPPSAHGATTHCSQIHMLLVYVLPGELKAISIPGN